MLFRSDLRSGESFPHEPEHRDRLTAANAASISQDRCVGLHVGRIADCAQRFVFYPQQSSEQLLPQLAGTSAIEQRRAGLERQLRARPGPSQMRISGRCRTDGVERFVLRSRHSRRVTFLDVEQTTRNEIQQWWRGCRRFWRRVNQAESVCQ